VVTLEIEWKAARVELSNGRVSDRHHSGSNRNNSADYRYEQSVMGKSEFLAKGSTPEMTTED
jgi:hypothetical protein